MDEKARILHTNLKTYIKDEIETGSDQYHAFVESMKGYGVPKGRLANAKSLYDKFVLLENVGKLGVGNYDSLRQMVKSSGLDELLPKINETDNEIKKLRAVSGESTGHIARKRQHDHSTGDARLPEAKQSRVEAEITDQELSLISNYVGIEWQRLLIDLKITQTKIDHIRDDHPYHVQDQIRHGLMMWRDQDMNKGRPRDSLIRELIDAAKKVHNADLEEILHNILGRTREDPK
ncbi:hypothetical protein MAR_000061 [Mya arenaria]|uniref:Death domain-containing protein n=1 Tax=Mya arenaria TaxID=6604 RepID=A0ABY7F7R8_MYAAR|nr:uncharacterized protein LOC128207972 [Mya arenaria]WAR18223.1 hypothetical protein MAR_000061 [Mya arenaria]